MNVAAANKIPVQRCLLDGGSCEASAYQLYGYRSVAASIGLGNYHNCAADGTIQCEYVSVDDYANMVRLCVVLVLDPRNPIPPGHFATRSKNERPAILRSFARFM